MLINIAVVDDSDSFLKVMSILLRNLEVELGVGINVDTYVSPLKYKLSDANYDIVVLDCIFKSYPININGLNLANFTKSKNKNTKVVLTSEFAQQEFLSLINEYSSSVDFYTTKKLDGNNIVEVIKDFISDIRLRNESLIMDIPIKLHVYKKGKEIVEFSKINYAKVLDREKHLITVNTAQGDITLSMTLNNFLNTMNNKFHSAGIKRDEEKLKSDLYVNIFNVENVDKLSKTILFKDNNELIVGSSKEIDNLNKMMKQRKEQ